MMIITKVDRDRKKMYIVYMVLVLKICLLLENWQTGF